MTRRAGRMFGQGAAAVLLSACGSSGASGACKLEVADSAALSRALHCARPGSEILLSPAAYGEVAVANADGLTLRAAKPATPPVFAALTVKRSRGVTLRDLAFVPPAGGDRYALLVTGSDGVTLDRLDFTGAGPAAGEQIVSAVMLRDSRDVTVRTSRFNGYWHGLSMLDLTQVRITDNHFRNLRTDAIRGGGCLMQSSKAM